MRPVLWTAAVCAAAACSPAFAHSRLVGAEPAAGTTVAAPAQLRLDFSEAVESKFTGAAVVCAGRDVAKGAAKPGGDARSVTIDLAAAPAGACEVTWRAVSVDGHRTQGTFRFTVR